MSAMVPAVESVAAAAVAVVVAVAAVVAVAVETDAEVLAHPARVRPAVSSSAAPKVTVVRVRRRGEGVCPVGVSSVMSPTVRSRLRRAVGGRYAAPMNEKT